jgi:hypothetical protein
VQRASRIRFANTDPNPFLAALYVKTTTRSGERDASANQDCSAARNWDGSQWSNFIALSFDADR